MFKITNTKFFCRIIILSKIWNNVIFSVYKLYSYIFMIMNSVAITKISVQIDSNGQSLYG